MTMNVFSDDRKTKAQDHLEKIQEIENKIRRKMVEKRRWFELATNTASNMSDDVRVQSSGSKEKMADAVVKGLVDDENIDKEIEKLKAERQEIIDLIESLPEPYCDILYRVYVEYESLKSVSYIRNESYNHTCKLHGIAALLVYNKLNNIIEVIEC